MKFRVLLVDDEPKVTRLLAQFLARFQHEIRQVNVPAHAVGMALHFGPDIIFSGLEMAAMHGGELAARLQAALPRPVPLIFLEKPLYLRQVLGALDDLCAEPALAAA
jgi:CheY-like chemotaxis protein